MLLPFKKKNNRIKYISCNDLHSYYKLMDILNKYPYYNKKNIKIISKKHNNKVYKGVFRHK